MVVDQKTAGLERDSVDTRCVLTVRLMFADPADVDDAVDTMQHCITDALSFENSIEEMPADDRSGPDSQDTRYALTGRLTFTDRVDADDVVDRIEHCLLQPLSFESSIEQA